MGLSSKWKSLLLFSKNSWRAIGDVSVSDSNIATSQCEEKKKYFNYKGKISLITDGKEYPDILVTGTGTEIDNKDNIIPAKEVIYVFNGKEYELKK